MEVCFMLVQEFMHTLDLFYPDKSFTGLQRPELSVECSWLTKSVEKFSVLRGDLYITLWGWRMPGQANKNQVQCWFEDNKKTLTLKIKISYRVFYYVFFSNWMPTCGALLKLIIDLTLALCTIRYDHHQPVISSSVLTLLIQISPIIICQILRRQSTSADTTRILIRQRQRERGMLDTRTGKHI